MSGLFGSLFGDHGVPSLQAQNMAQNMAQNQQAMNQAMAAQMQARSAQMQYDMSRQYSEEEDLRKNNPAVKDAWEQYQMTLRLAKK